MKNTSHTVVECSRIRVDREESLPSDLSGDSEAPEPARASSSQTKTELFTGVLTGFDRAGLALVKRVGNGAGETVRARSTVALTIAQIGSEVVLMFEQDSVEEAIILGAIQPECVVERLVQVTLDGEQLTLSADKEIVLRCGKASITLTREGKILVCGAYLLSRSSGVNRIKGASVQIN